MKKMRQSTKYWIYVLILNPVTTAIIWYMMQLGLSDLNIIGTGIIGYGIMLYFLVNAIRIDVMDAKKYRAAKGKGKKAARRKKGFFKK